MTPEYLIIKMKKNINIKFSYSVFILKESLSL